MNDNMAVEQLALLQNIPGALRIITNEHAHGPEAGCDESGFTLYDPRHFVIHDVIGIDEAPNGQLRAYSAEGDWCQGRPANLLKRLSEANRG